MKFKDLVKKVNCCCKSEDDNKTELEEESQEEDAQSTASGASQSSTDSKKPGKKPVKKPAAIVQPAEPQEVLIEKDYARLLALGLGRGVDGTDPTPWRNKSSFQVRRQINGKTLIGTDEGGYFRSYVSEVSSVLSQQTKLSASITVPKSPVDIGVDAEHSRSFHKTKKAEGVKIMTRTISFKTDFEDVVLRPTTCRKKEPEKSSSDAVSPKLKLESLDSTPPEGSPNTTEVIIEKHGEDKESVASAKEEQPKSKTDPPVAKPAAEENPTPNPNPQGKGDFSETDTELGNDATFEERLSHWLLKQLQQKYGGDTLSCLLEKITCQDKDGANIERDIKALCTDFVNCFSVTHYVSAVHLGAAKYQVISNKDYLRKVGASASLGVKKIVESEFSHSTSWKSFQMRDDLETIGVFTPADRSSNPRLVVRWRTEAEAVVGVQVLPISNLVRHPTLQQILQGVLQKYMSEKGDIDRGPFLISFNDDQDFLYVDSTTNNELTATPSARAASYQLTATASAKEASKFHIVPTIDGKRDEFCIVHHGTSNLREKHDIQLPAVARHLSSKVDWLGRNPGPLLMKFNVKEHHSRLTLQSRAVTRFRVDPATWAEGEDVFYINCSRRRWSIDGYLCVERRELPNPRQEYPPPAQYTTKCVTSTRCHDDENNFMLFRLIPERSFQHL